MNKRNPVYASKNGTVVKVTGQPPKDSLLFATSRKSVTEIRREKLAEVKKNSATILKAIAEATARN
ncbi:hypothetical protein [Aneurinibacillus tyrosinisolvens]|uniref:hypothetical protein n=1 Tax=Aneurinibacillus tyrosinisolvens TaxID=1443435 RepID=UPI00063F3B80|nr:hypothetical protein [Aneurinibacillus tyrosinisolvens]